MTNKTILITGSTDGIGKQTAIELAKFGSRIIIHGRNEQRCQETATELISVTGNPNINFVAADFSSLLQVKKMANSINSKYERLDVLINNAGVFENEKIFTLDEYETPFKPPLPLNA